MTVTNHISCISSPRNEKVTEQTYRDIRSLRALNTEDVMLNFFIYFAFAMQLHGLISAPIFFGCMLLFAVRVFNLRHEKAHLSEKNFSAPGLFQVICSHLSIYHTPYPEPLKTKRQKHLAHHMAHIRSNSALQRDVRKNPHLLFEQGPAWRAFLFAFLYEEVLLALDYKNCKAFTKDRLVQSLIAIGYISAGVMLVGFANFALFALMYRTALAISWFAFSYVLHIDALYRMDLGNRLPRSVKSTIDIILGSGATTAIFHHRFHHREPNRFHVY